ncbi:MAG TPA: pyridoxal-phosphate dependent enzyme [Actinomycetota bacterium]|nr:pyridoxal-phosphate dependent enzyme [Actinomycetota bacterium]
MDPLDCAPRVRLGRWPTPTRRLDNVSELLGREVWIKSEEECGTWGGNKVRKLEYILAAAEAHGARKLVTYGAGTSSWAAALVFHAVPRGFEVVLGLGGGIPDPNRRLYEKTSTSVFEMSSYNFTPVAAVGAMARAGMLTATRLPAGGSGLPGDLGSMGAGIEIGAALSSGELPVPGAIYCPAGTSGTAAGLAVGVAWGGHQVPIRAVRVTPIPLGTAAMITWHARRLAAFVAPRTGRSVRPAPVASDGRFFPPAYGASNAASIEAIEIARRDSLELDPTYAAKGFAALIDAARRSPGGPLLFLHTSPGPLPGPGETY